MNVLKRTRLVVAVAASLAVLAGCGSDEEGRGIPPDTAAALEARLAEVQRRFDFGGGACADITNDSAPAIQQTIDSLPSDVDQDVRDALQQSFDRLFELVQQQCEEPPPETDTTEIQPPETETTETQPPETETTETTDTEPPATEQPTTPTDTGEQTTPGDEGGGFGGDEGGGLGGGGGGGALVPEGDDG
jgi:hypothetical protein